MFKHLILQSGVKRKRQTGKSKGKGAGATDADAEAEPTLEEFPFFDLEVDEEEEPVDRDE